MCFSITNGRLDTCLKKRAFLNELKRIPTEAEIDAVIEQLNVNFEPAYEWMESLIKRRFT